MIRVFLLLFALSPDYLHAFQSRWSRGRSPDRASHRLTTASVASLESPPAAAPDTTRVSEENPLHVVIAGAGVGGLALANAFVGVPHVKTTVLEKTSQFKRLVGRSS